MKTYIYLIVSALFIFGGCKKNDSVRTSGTDTISTTTYQGTTYYLYGFSFSQGKLVTTEANPRPDLVIYVNTDNPNTPRLYFSVNNLKPSFWKAGEYSDESAAKTAFDNLKNVGPGLQWADFADPVKPNQVWIYRSQEDNYAKIRTISTVNETRNGTPYGECNFEWVYQPDGSTIFP